MINTVGNSDRCIGCQHYYLGTCSQIHLYGRDQAPITYNPDTCPLYQDVVYVEKGTTKIVEENKDPKRYNPHIETRFNPYCEMCPNMDGILDIHEIYGDDRAYSRSYVATCSYFDTCTMMHKWIKENG